MQENQFITEKRKFQVEEGILILLLILSLAGVAITDFSPDDGYGYWIFMVFVFGLFAILIGWLQSKHNDGEFKVIVKEQSMHCLTSLLGGCPRIEAVARESHFESVFSFI